MNPRKPQTSGAIHPAVTKLNPLSSTTIGRAMAFIYKRRPAHADLLIDMLGLVDMLVEALEREGRALPAKAAPVPEPAPAKQRKLQECTVRRLALHAQGLTDAEIAEVEGVQRISIKNWRLTHRLPSNHGLNVEQRLPAVEL